MAKYFDWKINAKTYSIVISEINLKNFQKITFILIKGREISDGKYRNKLSGEPFNFKVIVTYFIKIFTKLRYKRLSNKKSLFFKFSKFSILKQLKKNLIQKHQEQSI